MTTVLTRVVFVDQAGAVFQEVNLAAIPRVGDFVELTNKQLGGVIDRITWSVSDDMLSYPRVIARLKPLA